MSTFRWCKRFVGAGLLGLLSCNAPSQPAERDPEVPFVTGHSESGAPTSAKPGEEPISYVVSFPARHQNRVHVQATFPVREGVALELMMPVWTPGSYLVREYAQQVESLQAWGGPRKESPLQVTKVRKNRWRIAPPEAGVKSVLVEYVLYAHTWAVQANFVDTELAILNGAATFVTVADAGPTPHHVRLILPDDWPSAVTGLDGGASGQFTAESYDELVDSPIVVGQPQITEFAVDGVSHRLATFGGVEPWPQQKAAAEVAKLTEEVVSFWGHTPYRHYTYINVLGDAWGGLEHLDSTLMMALRLAGSKREDYIRWLGLVSHEFFHTWNGKRLRPAPLGPFDYEREVYTRSLWIAEGFTSYYDDLLLVRAGLVTEEEYLDLLSKNVERLQQTPGRLVHPLEMASYDAWIQFYRRGENFSNASVSYYTKGAMVAFVIDAEIRRRTQDTKSLDDVMRAAYERFSGERGYTPEEFRQVVAEVGGAETAQLLERLTTQAVALDYTGAFDLYGLQFKGSAAENDSESARDPQPGYLGVRTEGRGGRLMITSVLRDTPAFVAGLNPGDEILALEGLRVLPQELSARMVSYAPGSTVEVLLARRGKVITRQVKLSTTPEPVKIEKVKEATPEQLSRREAWLQPSRTGAQATR